MDRINKIRNLMKKDNLDVFLIHGGEHLGHNRFWTYGLEATAGFGIITLSKSIFLIDNRYYEIAKSQINNAEVKLLKKSQDLFDELSNIDGNRIGIEAEYTTTNFYKNIKEKLIQKQIIITKTNSLRMIKDSKEIKLIKKACSITEEVLGFVMKRIKPGMTEIDIKEMLMIEHIKRGTDGIKFEIVASGVRGSLPHGRASNKIIKNGEMITIDVGTSYKGYCSDITRTFVLGKECKHEELVKIYEIVKEAQKKGIQAIKPGIMASDIDKVCRDYIISKGYGEEFCHSTGHGLGIEVHEQPIINANSKQILEPGMVITIEPGIYIPNLGGVRIEDDVLVTKTGYEILNYSSKELKYINN